MYISTQSVMVNNYVKLDLDNTSYKDKKYMKLIKEQLDWLNEYKIQVIFKGDNLYALNKAKLLPKNIYDRCCDFELLEEKCAEYNKVSSIVV